MNWKWCWIGLHTKISRLDENGNEYLGCRYCPRRFTARLLREGL